MRTRIYALPSSSHRPLGNSWPQTTATDSQEITLEAPASPVLRRVQLPAATMQLVLRDLRTRAARSLRPPHRAAVKSSTTSSVGASPDSGEWLARQRAPARRLIPC